MVYQYIDDIRVKIQTDEKYFYATDRQNKVILLKSKFIFRRQGDLIRALANRAMYKENGQSQNYTSAKKQIESLIFTNQILIKQL